MATSPPMPAALQVVADPHRWGLLRELAHSDRRVGELAGLLDEPKNLVSYHLRELREAGLVSSRKSSFDGRDTYYRVDLDRCGRLLSAAGAALSPGVRLEVAPPIPVLPPDLGLRVLFLCTGNSARSQMAEALLRHLSGGAIRADSAGSHPKPLHPNAVRAMAARGLDISAQSSKRLEQFAGSQVDRVVTLCDRVREVCPEFAGAGEAIHWSIPDPAAAAEEDDASYPAFEAVAADLEVRIRYLIARLATP